MARLSAMRGSTSRHSLSAVWSAEKLTGTKYTTINMPAHAATASIAAVGSIYFFI